MLAEPFYRTRSARDQAISAHDIFCEEDSENAVTLTNSVVASAEHGHMFYSNMMFVYWKTSLRLQTKIEKDVRADPKGSK